jgi:cell division protein FtsZ
MLSAHRTRIRVVGCGGGGNSTITRLMETGMQGIRTLALNTDAQDLLYAQADDKILIGRDVTNGLGAGSNPQIGEDSARENQKEIEEVLTQADMVFITCGLGGGTGTGSAPVVAEIAKKLGALTIAIVTLPFTEEGIMRWENARLGLDKLRHNCDTVIVIQNDRLLEIVPDMPLQQAFKVADEILVNAVKGITELVTEKGLVNLDFADVRAIMRNGGTAMIGIGESEGAERAKKAVEAAVHNPLLDVKIIGAKNALINITGGADMSLKEAKTVMKIVAEKLDPTARVIWGARIDPSIDKAIRVMIIATGLTERDYPIIEIDAKESNMLADAVQHGRSLFWSQVTSANASTAKPGANTEMKPEGAWKDESAIPSQPRPSNNKVVFSKIFEEETRTDLQIMREAVADLLENPNNEARLREIRNAALAINNSAQLFAFNQIADFAAAVEELCERALGRELKLTDHHVDFLLEIPELFEGMIHGDADAFSESTRHLEKLRRLADDDRVVTRNTA